MKLVPIERMPLADVAAQIAAILKPNASPEVAADLWQRYQEAKRILAGAGEVLEEQMLAWLEANGRELVIGDTRYYPGHKTSEKVRDPHAALDSALSLSGGDVEVIERLLSRNALNAGACEREFGAEWRAQHFERKVSPKVEVKELNTRYLTKKGASNG